MTRALVAAGPSDLDRITDLLDTLGGRDPSARHLAPDRILVTAWYPGDTEAWAAVAVLRRSGFMAIAAPSGRGRESAWRHRTAPAWFGDAACVCQPWSEFDRAAASLVIEIDPGSGFGSGGHPTTQLVLEEISARLGPGDSVLDVGSGTGVLAVAAARLGAGAVVAIDIDPGALAATTANAVLNDVGDVVECRADPLAAIADRFDLVVANIHAGTLIELGEALTGRVDPAGQLVLGGLSPAQTSSVAAAMRPLEVTSAAYRDDWAALVLRRASR